jgi:GntR family transcriptional regulator
MTMENRTMVETAAGGFHISFGDPTPIYAQLERAIRFAIATERFRVGEQLPTVRQLAVDLRINANTVAKVYTELERVGILETRRGIGTFVRSRDLLAPRGRRGDRDRELNALASRFLADATALGFSLNEVIEHLRSTWKKES